MTFGDNDPLRDSVAMLLHESEDVASAGAYPDCPDVIINYGTC